MANRAWWRPLLKAALIIGYFGVLAGVAFVPVLALMGLERAGAIDDAKPWLTLARIAGVLIAVAAVLTVGRVDVTARGRALRALRRWAGSRRLVAGGNIGIAYARDGRRGLDYGSAPVLIAPDVPLEPFARSGTPRAALALSRPADIGTLSLVVYSVERALAHDADDVSRVDTTLLLLHGLGPLAVATIEPREGAEAVAARLGGADIHVESAAFNASWRVAAEDAQGAHAILSPTVIERLLADDARELSLASIPGALVASFDAVWPGADALDRASAVLEGVAAALPGHLRGKGAGGEPPARG